MPGSYEEKFAALKALMSYMIAEPGKKLLFMGGEFAQFIEWDYQKELDWGLLEYPKHKEFHNYVKALNRLYLKSNPLYETDCDFNGYKWIVVDDKTQNIIVFKRTDLNGDYIIVIINFSPVGREKYDVGVSDEGRYKAVLNSDAIAFGGKTKSNTLVKARRTKQKTHGEDFAIRVKIPPNGAMFIRNIDRNINK
jgi:1,4-alpha-glucan branching enzyme